MIKTVLRMLWIVAFVHAVGWMLVMLFSDRLPSDGQVAWWACLAFGFVSVDVIVGDR